MMFILLTSELLLLIYLYMVSVYIYIYYTRLFNGLQESCPGAQHLGAANGLPGGISRRGQ